jgi:hypothetical protein
VSDLRDRLRARTLPSVTVSIRLDHSVEADAAEQELEQARLALEFAIKTQNPDDHEVRVRVGRAEEIYDQYLEHFEVKVIPPALYEQIIAACPPTEEQQAKGFMVNPDTFRPALLAACVSGELSESDWLEMESTGELTPGELATLYQTAKQLNERSPDVMVGKGSSPTRS